MSKIFTDEQIKEMRDLGHPAADLMDLINGHTNSRAYAAENLSWLAEVAAENLKIERSARSKLSTFIKMKAKPNAADY